MNKQTRKRLQESERRATKSQQKYLRTCKGYDVSKKKLRGVPRKLREIKKWSESFKGAFPSQQVLEEAFGFYDGYEYLLNPISNALSHGHHSTTAIKSECAQYIIDATHYLIQSKPDFAKDYRVNCRINVEFLSDSRIYIHEADKFYLSQVKPRQYSADVTEVVKDQSLAEEWGLVLLEGVAEMGIRATNSHPDLPDVEVNYWFGEVS